MRRRALLGAIAGLSIGCLETSGFQTNRPTTRTRIGRSEPPERCDGRVTTTPAGPTTTSPSEQTADGAYRITEFSFSSSTEQPSFRYLLDVEVHATERSVRQRAGEATEDPVVVDVSTVERDELRRAIETAVYSEEGWRSNTLPRGLAELVRRVDFFTGFDGRESDTHLGLRLYRMNPDQEPVVGFSAAVADDLVSSGSPGAIVLSASNLTAEPQTVSAGTVPPFGLVRASRGDGEEPFLLWREYESEGCVRILEDGTLTVCAIGTITELPACGRLTRRYQILPPGTDNYPDLTVPLGEGTYLVDGGFGHSTGYGGDQSVLSYEVEFDLVAL